MRVVNCWVFSYNDRVIVQTFDFNNFQEAQECFDIEERCGTWDNVTIDEII
jgi:hypothetical protein